MLCKLCEKEAKSKGLCSAHYTQYRRKQIDLDGNILQRPVCQVTGCTNDHTTENGLCWPHYRQKIAGIKLSLKSDPPPFEEKNKLPGGWGNCNAVKKRIHITASSDIGELKAIADQDIDKEIRALAQSILLQDFNVTVTVPEMVACKYPGCIKTPDQGKFVMGYCTDHYRKTKDSALYKVKHTKCKIEGCTGEPQHNGYPKGFCAMHYLQYKEEKIDFDGNALENRRLSSRTAFNALVLDVAKLFYDANETLRGLSRRDPYVNGIMNVQVGLSFIKSPNFIMGCMSELTNATIRALLNNEEDRQALKGMIDKSRAPDVEEKKPC